MLGQQRSPSHSCRRTKVFEHLAHHIETGILTDCSLSIPTIDVSRVKFYHAISDRYTITTYSDIFCCDVWIKLISDNDLMIYVRSTYVYICVFIFNILMYCIYKPLHSFLLRSILN